MQCYDEAARAFGWAKREPKPGSMREGEWLVGWGCATATYPTQVAPATEPTATFRVETAAHDVGTGAYTVIAQMAGEKLGVDLGKIDVTLGDTTLPPAPVAGGSNTTASLCSVVGLRRDSRPASGSGRPSGSRVGWQQHPGRIPLRKGQAGRSKWRE
jgi:xanthine dehydrogenase YagR molybdenum-binding subunit